MQKKIKAGNAWEEPVHVQIARPITVRKNILSATIDVTRILKTHEELKDIREEKHDILVSLKGVHSEIFELARGFEKKGLPLVHLPEDKKHKEYEFDHKSVKEVVVNSEINRLKAELGDIERKLKSLE